MKQSLYSLTISALSAFFSVSALSGLGFFGSASSGGGAGFAGCSAGLLIESDGGGVTGEGEGEGAGVDTGG